MSLNSINGKNTMSLDSTNGKNAISLNSNGKNGTTIATANTPKNNDEKKNIVNTTTETLKTDNNEDNSSSNNNKVVVSTLEDKANVDTANLKSNYNIPITPKAKKTTTTPTTKTTTTATKATTTTATTATPPTTTTTTTTTTNITKNIAQPIINKKIEIPVVPEKLSSEKELLSRLENTKTIYSDVSSSNSNNTLIQVPNSSSTITSTTNDLLLLKNNKNLENEVELEKMIVDISEAEWDINWSRDAYSSFKKLDSLAKKVVLQRLVTLAKGDRYFISFLH
jgi:hypothetical protein